MILKRILLVFTVCFFLSCDDFLDQEPDLQVSINEQLASKEGVLQAYSGIYRDVEDVYSSLFAVYADVMGGNISFTPSSGSEPTVEVPNLIADVYDFNATEDALDFETYYNEWYNIINQVNLLLEYQETFSFLSPEENNQLTAELLTIRALAHYQIALVFAQNYNFTADASHLGVVYNTNTLVAGVDFPVRKTMFETYNLIQTDLDNALPLYTTTQLLSGTKTSYFSPTSTRALYARISLQMTDWEKAEEYSNGVITTSGIALITKENYLTAWVTLLDANNIPIPRAPLSETILEFTAPRTSEGSVSSSISTHFNVTSSAYSDYVASGDILALYESTDIRQNMFIDANIPTNINGVLVDRSYFFTRKFQGEPGTLFLRLSEMYLIRAEANTRLNNLDLALSDINRVRERANLSTLTSTADLLEEVFLERRKELAFEGHLLFDLKRYKKNITRNLGCISTLCTLNYPSNFYILPIPFKSVSLNQNIEQNEGY